MNIPLSSLNSHLIVQIPSVNSAILHPPTNSTDVHICGTCKQNFFDINYFLEHKLTCQSSPLMLHKSLVPGSIVNQNGISYVTTTANSTNNEEVIPVLSPLFQMVVNGRDLKLPSPANSEENNSIKSELLDETTMTLAETLSNATLLAHPNNSSSSQTFHNENPDINLTSKRDFQIDQETILVNQLTNEVCSFQADNLGEAEALLQLSSLTCEIDFNGSKDSCMVSPEINLEGQSTTLLPNTSSVPMPSETEKDNLNKSELTDNPSPLLSSPPVTTKPTTTSTPNRKIRKCDYEKCTFSTKYLKDLIRHIRKHTGERPYKCNQCDLTFNRNDKLLQHIKTHTGEKPHKCQLCPYAATDVYSLRKHLRKHTGERPYKCQMCSYRSKNSSQLSVHLRIHTGDQPFNCSFCSSAFKTNSDLTRHKRIHTGEKPYQCIHCEFRCSVKSNLSNHIKYIHTDKKFPCKSCDMVFNTKKEVLNHEEEHTGEILTCSSCEFTTTSQTRMNIHSQLHVETNFHCVICNFNYKKYSCLKSHMRRKHPELIKKKTKTTKKKLTSNVSKMLTVPSYKCTLCDSAFVREESWRCHMRQHSITQTTNTITHEESTNSIQNNIPLTNETSVYIYLQQNDPSSAECQQESLQSNIQVPATRFDLVVGTPCQQFIDSKQLAITFVENFHPEQSSIKFEKPTQTEQSP